MIFQEERTCKDEFPHREKDKAYCKWLHNHNTEQGPDLRIKYNRLRNKVRDHTRKLRKIMKSVLHKRPRLVI